MGETKRVLITGVNGFVGSHLAEACAARGWDVFGTIRSFRSNLKNLSSCKPKLIACDIADQESVRAAIRESRPDYVFHLAAHSFVPTSWSAPRAALDVNVFGTLHVLEAVRREHPDAAVQVAGSSEEYGRVEANEVPITEQSPLRPLSPYGVSKVAADLLTQQYAASYGMRAMVTRAFNHTGPRRGAAFAESQWAREIALREQGLASGPVLHGNLDAIRDYTDVRDIVLGYIAVAERGISGRVYNLASGEFASPTMGDVLSRLAALAHVEITTEANPKYMRPSDVPRLIGDAARAARELKWAPTIQLPQTLSDLLNYWRGEISAEAEISRRAQASAA